MSHIKRKNSRINLAAGILALEPRMMFDGAAVVDAAHAAADAAAKALIPDVTVPAVVRTADPSKDSGKKEVVFVDTALANYQALEAAVKDGVGIVEIDGGQSGLAQMAKWAEANTGYDSITVIGRGSEASLQLGTDTIADASLSGAATQAEMAEIGAALKSSGELLIEANSVGQGLDGQLLVKDMGIATGATVGAFSDTTDPSGADGHWTLDTSTGAIQVQPADPSLNGGKTEVVFIDTSVADYRTLMAAVNPGVEIELIDGSQDGLAQMAKWAQTHAGYDSISILSHGAEAAVRIGTSTVNDSSLGDAVVQAELDQVGHSLNADGGLLLYGCDVAKGDDGRQFATDLAAATGADVAASTDTTGNNGNWTLEYVSSSNKYLTGTLSDGVYQYAHDLLSVGNGTLTIYSIWNVSQTATGLKFTFNIYNSSTNTDGPFTIKGQWGSQTEYTLITHFNSGWGDFTGHDWGVTWADLGGAPTGGAGTKYVSFYLYASGTGIPLTGLSDQESFGYNPNVTPAFVSSGTTNLTFAPGATAHDITSYLGITDSDSSQTETWSQSVAPNNGGSLLFTSATGTSGAGTISPTGAVTYTPNASFVGTETFTVQVSDGTATATKSFSALVDNAPTVTAGGTTAYTERTPTAIAPAISIADADGNTEWNGGTLAVNISANADATDKLYLATSQPGSAGYWVDAASSNAIKYWDGSANTAIGTASATQVTGSSTWTITFNASATNTLVSGLAQAILYDDNTHIIFCLF